VLISVRAGNATGEGSLGSRGWRRKIVVIATSRRSTMSGRARARVLTSVHEYVFYQWIACVVHASPAVSDGPPHSIRTNIIYYYYYLFIFVYIMYEFNGKIIRCNTLTILVSECLSRVYKYTCMYNISKTKNKISFNFVRNTYPFKIHVRKSNKLKKKKQNISFFFQFYTDT